jgi:hypothetical protein
VKKALERSPFDVLSVYSLTPCLSVPSLRSTRGGTYSNLHSPARPISFHPSATRCTASRPSESGSISCFGNWQTRLLSYASSQNKFFPSLMQKVWSAAAVLQHLLSQNCTAAELVNFQPFYSILQPCGFTPTALISEWAKRGSTRLGTLQKPVKGNSQSSQDHPRREE